MNPQPPSPGPFQKRGGKVWGPGKPGERVPIDANKAARSLGPMATMLGFGDGDMVRRLVLMAGVFVGFSAILYSHYSAKPVKTLDTAAIASEIAAIETQQRARPFQGLLDEATDGLSIDELEASQPYRTLLWNLKILNVAEVTSLSEEVPATDLLRRPSWHRGHFVRASGVLVAPLTPRRIAKNEAGYEIAWRGILVDTADSENVNAFAFDLFEKPEQTYSRDDTVIVEGVFLQTVSYEGRDNRKRTVPFLQAKSVRPLTGERTTGLSSSTTLLLLAAFGVLSLPFIGLAISSALGRRHEDQLLVALEKARSRRPTLPGKRSPPEPPPAEPTPPEAAPTRPEAAPTPPEAAPPRSQGDAPPPA